MDRRYKRLVRLSLGIGGLISSIVLFVFYQYMRMMEPAFVSAACMMAFIFVIMYQANEDATIEPRRQYMISKLRALPGAVYRIKLTHEVIDLQGIHIETDRAGSFIIYHGSDIDCFWCMDVTLFDAYIVSERPVIEWTFKYTTLRVEGEK